MFRCKTIAILLHALFLVDTTDANQYDPHVIPTKGPYFEGWYTRIVDFDHDISFGALFGMVLPQNTYRSRNLVYAGLLLSDRTRDSQLEIYNSFPPRLDCFVKDGRAVLHKVIETANDISTKMTI